MRKTVQRLFAILLCITALFLSQKSIFANEIEDIDAIDIDEKKQQSLIEEFDPAVEDTDNGIKTGEISCFDVNTDGRIAVGYINRSSRTYISVYNEDFDFIYGYSLSLGGDYGIAWQDMDLIVYVVRGNYLICLDEAGNITSIRESKSSDYSMQKAFKSTTREASGRTYHLGNGNALLDKVFSKYSMLSVYENGEKRILFDRSASFQIKTMIASFVILSMAIICVVFIIARIKKNKAAAKENSSHEVR